MLQMIRITSVLGLILTLSGCGLAMQAEEKKVRGQAAAIRDAELADCYRKYPDDVKRPVTPRVNCIWDARMKFARLGALHGYRHLDLEEVFRAKIFLLAEQYDSGNMSEAQYRLEKAQAESDFKSKVMQRENSAAMVAAAEEQATAASLATISASRPLTCSTYGNTTTCH